MPETPKAQFTETVIIIGIIQWTMGRKQKIYSGSSETTRETFILMNEDIVPSMTRFMAVIPELFLNNLRRMLCQLL